MKTPAVATALRAFTVALALAGCASNPAPRSPQSASSPAVQRGVVVYTVAPGDILGTLAARFHVTGGASALARLNQLEHPDVLRAGRGILLPENPPFTDSLPHYQPPAPSHETLTACESRSFSSAPDATVPGCARAACAEIERSRVCACVSPEGAGSIRVLANGADVARWPAIFAGGADPVLHVERADLDGDGRVETVVGWLATIGGGLRLHGWGVAVLTDGAREPLTFAAAEYGRGSLLSRADGRGCTVFATEWVERRDAILGPGLYLLGRRYEYGSGALRATGEPVLARRMLSDLADAVGALDGVLPLGVPVEWLGAERAERVTEDPVAGPSSPGARAGTIASASPDATAAPGRVLQLAFDVAQGPTVALGAGALPDSSRLGDAAAGVPWPRGYFPADVTSWRGRAARLVEYRSPAGEPRSVLWVVAPR